MRKFNIRKVSEAGSLMVEAIAMLGLISMVTPVVYKKSAERMNELQDINAASQMRTLSSALDAYLSDHYAELTGEDAPADGNTVDINKLAAYLPQGMVSCSPGANEGDPEVCGLYGVLGDDYQMSYVRNTVTEPDPTDPEKTKVISDTLTGYVGAKNDENIDAKRASRIATMIGGNGGVVDGNMIYGAQGVWETGKANVRLNSLNDNSIVAASSSTVGSGGNIDTDEFLHRHEQSRSELNTMYTDLYMYDGSVANDIMGVGRLLIGSQVDQHEGRQNSFKPLGETPPTHEGEKNYSLYVGAVDQGNRNYDGSAYIQDALHAVEDQFKVEKESLTYNPFTAAVGTEGEEGYQPDTKEQNGTFKVDTTGLKYTDPKAAEFSLTDNTMTYGGVKEEGGEGSKTLIKAVYEDLNDDDKTSSSSGHLEVDSDELRIAYDTAESGANHSIVETKTHRFIANHSSNVEGNFAYNDQDNGVLTDSYKRIGDGNPITFTNDKSKTDNDVRHVVLGNRDNVLTGHTVATEIETGYLKTHDFDVARLRAGRENLADPKDNKYGWELQADEDSVEMGSYADYLGDSDNAPLQDDSDRAGLRVLDKRTAPSVKMQVTNSTGGSNTFELNDGTSISDERDGGLTATINEGGIDMEINNGGDYNVEVNGDGNYKAMVEKGYIRLKTGKTGSEEVTNMNSAEVYVSENGGVILTSDTPSKDMTNGEEVSEFKKVEFSVDKGGIKAEFDDASYNTLYIDDSYALKNKDEPRVDGYGKDASVYIRHGAIELRDKKNAAAANNTGAIDGAGYVLVDRFVVENGAEDSNSRDPRDVYKNNDEAFYTGESQDTQYDHYMVDPAYTSVMHDIKLTSRGGARLSDILPDFINKGIYVVDNSYDEGVDPRCFSIYGDKSKSAMCNTGLGSGDSDTDYASAYLGGIPAPQCPPGYAKVITLQPSGWTMGQVGTLVIDVSKSTGKSRGRGYIQPIDNLAKIKEALDGDSVGYSGTHYTNKITLDKDNNEVTHGSSYSGTTKSGSVQNYGSSVADWKGKTSTTDDVATLNDLYTLAEKIDRLIQSSTYMKSAIKVKKTENEITAYGSSTGASRTTTSDDFVGWDTYIGFIYPASYWNRTAGLEALGFHTDKDMSSFSSGVFWNLFPVDKYSIEGYATVYCYFDRQGIMNGDNGDGTKSDFDSSLVDTTYNQFDKNRHRDVSAGSNKYKDSESDYVKRLHNPKLKYNDQW